MLNNFVLNPATTGIESYTDLKIGHRTQWVGIDGAPRTSYLMLHTPIGKEKNSEPPVKGGNKPIVQKKHKYRKEKPHHGLGAVCLTDKIGPFRQNELGISYAYHLVLSGNLKLSQGVYGGVNQYVLDTDMLTLEDPNDNLIQGGVVRRYTPNIRAGMWLYSERYYLGVSGSQIFGDKISFDGDEFQRESKIDRHYYLTSGYKFYPSRDFVVEPSVILKYITPVPASIDFSVRTIYKGTFWGGLSYRYKESVIVLLGVNLNHRLQVAYAYDASVSGLSGTNSGSHEFILGFRIRNKYKVICPSYSW